MAGPRFVGRLPKPVLVLIAVTLVLGTVATVLLMRLSQLKWQLVAKQQHITFLTAHNDELQQQLAKLEVTRKGLEERLNALRSELASATEELGTLRSSVTALQARYDALKDENVYLEMQVGRLTKERDEAKDELKTIQDDKQDLERTAARLRERLTLLDRDYQRLSNRLTQLEQARDVQTTQPVTSPQGPTPPMDFSSSSPVSSLPATRSTGQAGTPKSNGASASSQTVELPPIVVRKDQAGTGLPIRARLVEVNAAHRFVVIDKGANDGVRVGMAFEILRGGGTVGQAVAVRVRPQLAACDIIASRSPGSFQVGDLVVQHSQ